LARTGRDDDGLGNAGLENGRQDTGGLVASSYSNKIKSIVLPEPYGP